ARVVEVAPGQIEFLPDGAARQETQQPGEREQPAGGPEDRQRLPDELAAHTAVIALAEVLAVFDAERLAEHTTLAPWAERPEGRVVEQGDEVPGLVRVERVVVDRDAERVGDDAEDPEGGVSGGRARALEVHVDERDVPPREELAAERDGDLERLVETCRA